MPATSTRTRRIWPLLLLCAALSTAVHAESVPTAQPDPALARGFAPEQLFQGFAELDNVNNFNGGLVIPVPLGQEYPVGGRLSYQLSVVYNSGIWDIQTVNNGLGSWNKARPARLSNAGVGWSLTLGQLFHPDDTANDATRGEWLSSSYLDRITLPDGSSFRFQYSYDTNAPADACTVEGGRLREMTLPTQGRIQWTWQRYLFPNEICGLDNLVDCGPDCQWRRFVGVAERTLY